MVPSAERLLRPVLAFLTLCLAAFLLAPTVASVHHKVEELHFDRPTPFHLWRWSRAEPPSLPFPNCGGTPMQLYSEVTEWPKRIRKDETFNLRGVVQNEDRNRIGVSGIKVDIFLNDTKSQPGVPLGEVESDLNGYFALSTSIPFDLQAEQYHIVAHAKEKRVNCDSYREHWSDPEVNIISRSTIVLERPDHPVAGRELNLTGRLVDSVGGPVKNASLNVSVGGSPQKLITDEDGRFRLSFTPEKAGELVYKANFTGTEFYEGSTNQTKIDVAEEDIEVTEPIAVVRSEKATLAGRIYVAEAARRPTITLGFDGFNATACEGCPANATHEVPVAEDGTFSLAFVAPSSERPGLYTVGVSGGGLKRSYTYNVTLDVPTVLAVHSNGTGLFTRGYEGRAVLTDETGAPLVGQTLTLALPVVGSTSNTTDANGTVVFAGSSDCGARTVHARFAGAERIRGASAQDDLFVCGFLAFIPAWLLAIPWWVWPLALVSAFVAWQLVRGWRQRYAPVILGGPALTLTFTEPSDEAAGYATIGEAVVATAFLEEPLPDGHRLRMGAHRHTAEVPLDAELRAHWRSVPEKLGDVVVRAEIVDPKGRVVSRRSATLRVVRYGEEIERRYLALREAHGQSEAVTPREFERWLHERAPDLDPDVVRRLVRLFEEADYSPRTAGRAEFAAYLAAEGGVQGVRADAPLA